MPLLKREGNGRRLTFRYRLTFTIGEGKGRYQGTDNDDDVGAVFVIIIQGTSEFVIK